MSTPQTARLAIAFPEPKAAAPAGHNGSLNGHETGATQNATAVEGKDSPQASATATPKGCALAGNGTAQPAIRIAAPTPIPLAGHQAGRGQRRNDTQAALAPAADIPGAQVASAAQRSSGTGDQAPPAAIYQSGPRTHALLADPLLSLAAAVLDDIERARMGNENRLRSLAGRWERDGQIHGYGLTPPGFDPAGKALVKGILATVQAEVTGAAADGYRPEMPGGWHPVKHRDVWDLSLVVLGLRAQEHQAELQLCRHMRKSALEPWRKAHHGVGSKQLARLLGEIGDPYIRPDIARKKDGEVIAVEPERPRTVSDLWAYCGLHTVGGIAARRQKYVKANWSAVAKSRAYRVAEACMKTLRAPCRRAEGDDYAIHAEGCHCSPYRLIYDQVRERLESAVHHEECVRCGPSGKPALAGSPLSMAHKKNWALRIAAKAILKDLWREAKRIHREGDE